MLQLGSMNTPGLPSLEFGEYETTFSKTERGFQRWL